MEKKRAVFCISILAQELIFYSFFLSLILPWFLRCNSFLGSSASLKILLFFFLLPKHDLHQSLVLQLLSSVHTLAAILVTLIISSFLMVIKHQVFLFSQIFSLMCTKAYLTLPLESPLAPQTQMCKSNFSFSPHYTSLHSFIKAGSKLCWGFSHFLHSHYLIRHQGILLPKPLPSILLSPLTVFALPKYSLIILT